ATTASAASAGAPRRRPPRVRTRPSSTDNPKLPKLPKLPGAAATAAGVSTRSAASATTARAWASSATTASAASAAGGQNKAMSAARTVAVIGASNIREKFGNKAVRAYLRQGWTVYPVNPNEREVEGLKSYPSITDIPGPVTRATLYLPPEVGVGVLEG